MNEQLMDEEVVTEEESLNYEETGSESSILPGVVIGVVSAVVSGIVYKKWVKPVGKKIWNKFKKEESEEFVESTDNQVVNEEQN